MFICLCSSPKIFMYHHVIECNVTLDIYSFYVLILFDFSIRVSNLTDLAQSSSLFNCHNLCFTLVFSNGFSLLICFCFWFFFHVQLSDFNVVTFIYCQFVMKSFNVSPKILIENNKPCNRVLRKEVAIKLTKILLKLQNISI